jgi:hypothetical protein
MSGSGRARLARMAQALGSPRARLRGLPGGQASAVDFACLSGAPDWLALPAPDRRSLARLAALAAMAPALAQCIDGHRLRALADAVGPDDLDWAIGLGSAPPSGLLGPAAPGGVPAEVPHDRLDETGVAILAAALPAGMSARLSPLAPPCLPDTARWAAGAAHGRLLAR